MKRPVTFAIAITLIAVATLAPVRRREATRPFRDSTTAATQRFETPRATPLAAMTAPPDEATAVERAESFAASADMCTSPIVAEAARRARRDPAAAFAWACERVRTSVGDAGEALRIAGEHYFHADPKAAFAAAGAILSEEDLVSLLPLFGRAWIERDAATACDRARRIPAGDLRDAFVRGLIDGALPGSPRLAAELALGWAAPGGSQHRALERVISHWTEIDPAAAAVWIEAFHAGEARTMALRAVLWHWSAADAPAATVWLARQPADAARDVALARMIERAAPRDPEFAALWAHAIADQSLRHAAHALVEQYRDFPGTPAAENKP